jgi:hypothetical protein
MRKVPSDLPEYRKLIALIPGGTIQFLDLGFDLRKQGRIKTEFYEHEIPDLNDPEKITRKLYALTKSDDGEGYIDAQTGELFVDPVTNEIDPNVQPTYSISTEKALAPFLDKWVPIPFFRLSGNLGPLDKRYRLGPTDWVRARVEAIAEPEDDGITHKLVIAFDTHYEADIDVTNVSIHEGYGSLAEMDVHDGAEFSLVGSFKKNSWFLSLEWVSDWLKQLFDEMLMKRRPDRPLRDSDFQYQNEHLARYAAFVELLEMTAVIPMVKLTDPRRHTAPIDVDLVLDIGNARTIGMLIEKRADANLSLDNGSVLELRDLSRPTQMHRDTFRSYLCFSRARFGDSGGYARGSGRLRPGFSWPSVVRVGSEAARLAVNSRREEGQTSMSSPKRYLWDLEPPIQGWRYAPDPDDPASQESPVNSGDFVGFINNEGTPLHAFSGARPKLFEHLAKQNPYPVTDPRFSRSSLMMFLIAEIVSHALVQINSPAQRNDRLNPDIPRRLRRIILTAPPAMSVSERKIFKQWAKWAIDVLWKALDWDDFGQRKDDYRQKPIIKMDLDEASATQLVFVYNEIEKKFAGDSAEYLKIFGKSRQKYHDQPSLRVASIDIGGGTTDMVITTYLAESASVANIIVPHQEFREGFNFAGDDLMKVVIESHLIPDLLRYLSMHDYSVTQETVLRKLGKDVIGLSEKDRNLRAQFAQQILVPIVLEIFAKMEELPVEDLSSFSAYQLDHQRVIAIFDKANSDVLEFIENLVSEKAGSDFSLRSWIPAVDLEAIGVTISAAITPYLHNLAELVRLWDCDFLVLSGRPTCLSTIRAILYKAPPVQPSRIVSMSEYQVESWYPFWTTLDGKIDDPKTTGVVGALLSAVSEGNLKNFHIRTNDLRPASTIKYLGTMGNDKQIKNVNLLFDGRDISVDRDEELVHILPFQTQMFIGFRQMKVERWKTTPFYYLRFSSQEAAERANHMGPYQLHLSYQRRFEDDELDNDQAENEGVLKIEEISAKDGSSVPRSDVVAQLKSLWADSHWLDTGLFDNS